MNRPDRSVEAAQAQDPPGWWRRSTLMLATLGSLLLCASHPPVGLAPLAVLAPVPWLLLVRLRQLPGRRPMLACFVASFIFWMIMLQGLRHPHWALKIGWVVLSLYAALYFPLFITLTRLAVQRLSLPLLIAAPVAWVAVEMLRSRLLTGFCLAQLGHALTDVPLLIQTADLGGAYLVGALIMAASAALAQAVPLPSSEARQGAAVRSLVGAALLISAALGYGAWRLAQPQTKPQLTVALLQGARDVFYEYDPKVNEEMFLSYRHFSRQACRAHPEVDLVIWPESSLAAHLPEVIIDGPLSAPPQLGLADSQYQRRVENSIQEFHDRLMALATDISPGQYVDLIVSGETIHAEGTEVRRFNSTLLVRDDGKLEQRYYKMQPVMFGEYIPFGRAFPWLYDITPMNDGLVSGLKPEAMAVGGLTFSPSICFESTLPHLIRGQLAELRRAGQMPDVLINPSNDGWFHGSSILDLHANCMVFRAVENHRPVLSAANGGLTSWIDDRGRVQARLPRKTENYLIARCGPGRGVTVYQWAGDWFGWLCVASTLGLALTGMRRSAIA